MDGVSVCVPMYNNEGTIERCLRSILDQDGALEIVVVDDDSTDASVELAASLLRPGDRLIRNPGRLGLAGNHNRALELARGGLIQFVHADDWLLPGALQSLARCFDDPEVGMAFAPRLVVGDDEWAARFGEHQHWYFWDLRDRNRGASLVAQIVARSGAANNPVGEPTCVMFRRGLALDGMRSDLYQLVDLDLWLRVMLRSAVVRYVQQPLSVRSHTPDTATSGNKATRRDWLDQMRILTSLIHNPASTPTVRLLAAAWWLPSVAQAAIYRVVTPR